MALSPSPICFKAKLLKTRASENDPPWDLLEVCPEVDRHRAAHGHHAVLPEVQVLL